MHSSFFMGTVIWHSGRGGTNSIYKHLIILAQRACPNTKCCGHTRFRFFLFLSIYHQKKLKENKKKFFFLFVFLSVHTFLKFPSFNTQVTLVQGLSSVIVTILTFSTVKTLILKFRN